LGSALCCCLQPCVRLCRGRTRDRLDALIRAFLLELAETLAALKTGRESESTEHFVQSPEGTPAILSNTVCWTSFVCGQELGSVTIASSVAIRCVPGPTVHALMLVLGRRREAEAGLKSAAGLGNTAIMPIVDIKPIEM
jgi:hypothetical protein